VVRSAIVRGAGAVFGGGERSRTAAIDFYGLRFEQSTEG
jgi:hypothetical protein